MEQTVFYWLHLQLSANTCSWVNWYITIYFLPNYKHSKAFILNAMCKKSFLLIMRLTLDIKCRKISVPSRSSPRDVTDSCLFNKDKSDSRIKTFTPLGKLKNVFKYQKSWYLVKRWIQSIQWHIMLIFLWKRIFEYIHWCLCLKLTSAFCTCVV